MAFPFSASSPEPSKPRPQEVDPDDTPHLLCRKCGLVVVRSAINQNEWVHEDDVMIFPAENPLNFSVSKYDHEALPDYIEVVFRDTTP